MATVATASVGAIHAGRLLSGLWLDRERGTGVANDSSGAYSGFSAVEEQGAVGRDRP